MKSFDCQLESYGPLIRVQAADAAAAQAEYFRRYSIVSSVAPWTCKEVKEGNTSPAPIEPEAWVMRRKELGTFEAAATVDQRTVEQPKGDRP